MPIIVTGRSAGDAVPLPGCAMPPMSLVPRTVCRDRGEQVVATDTSLTNIYSQGLSSCRVDGRASSSPDVIYVRAICVSSAPFEGLQKG